MKKILSRGLAALAFFGVCFPAVFFLGVIQLDAQVDDGLTGRLIDQATGGPIANAQVEVLRLDGSRIGPLGLQDLTGPNG